MPHINISMLFPQSFPAWKISDAVQRVRRHLIGLEYSLDYEAADTDGVCVDCFPSGMEGEIYGIASGE